MTFYPDGRDDDAASPTPGPRLPAPGWLPDPSETRLERYWDGFRWTPRTRDRATGIEHAVYSPGVASPLAWTAPEPRRRNTGPTVLIVLAIVIVALNAYRWAGNLGYLPEWGSFAGGWGSPYVIEPPTQADLASVETPVSGYPTFGTTELVRRIEEGLLTQERRIDVTTWAREVGQDGVFDAYTEAYVQNPYAFGGGGTYLDDGNRVYLEPEYVYSDEEAEHRRAVTYAAVQAGLSLSGAADASSEREKVTAIHDYIVGLAEYDYEAYGLIQAGDVSSARVEQSQEAYGIFASRTAVCNGYAQAFLAMADAAGLEAVQVTGTASSGMTVGGHAWNRVLVDGQWWVVDTTWDDPEGASGLVQDYLMLSPDDPALASRTVDSDWVVDSEMSRFS
ncbi:MAG: transglutaminase domain-containing protein [Demequina sp.]|uniref:transglutaminase domain-containing protein n=1 Tax=Demequina sp. TaxID=2050685 RepID=UPI003A89426B